MPALTPAAVGAQQLKCYELRLAGHTLDQIAKDTGLSVSTVRKRLSERVHWAAEEVAENVRAYEFDRLNSMWTKLKPKVDEGDLEAMRVAIRLSESMRKLVGADAPTQITGTVEHTVAPEVADLVARARERNERQRAAITGSATRVIDAEVVDTDADPADPDHGPDADVRPLFSASGASTDTDDPPPVTGTTASLIDYMDEEQLAELVPDEDLDDPSKFEGWDIDQIRDYLKDKLGYVAPGETQ